MLLFYVYVLAAWTKFCVYLLILLCYMFVQYHAYILCYTNAVAWNVWLKMKKKMCFWTQSQVNDLLWQKVNKTRWRFLFIYLHVLFYFLVETNLTFYNSDIVRIHIVTFLSFSKTFKYVFVNCNQSKNKCAFSFY